MNIRAMSKTVLEDRRDRMVEIDYDALEQHLRVLGYANRLELLHLLQWPKTVDEIELRPSASQAGENPDRKISRQAVQNHLNRLAEAGLVQVGTTRRKGGREVQEYRIDHAQLFAVLEELRKLSVYDGPGPVDPFETGELDVGSSSLWEEGPKLVLVHGVGEGRVFPLRDKEIDSPRGWVVGRAPSAHVALPYDPFISTENSEILRTKEGYRLLDLRTAKNGTLLNWRRLPIGGETPLKGGDVIGVGRSLLVFRDG